MGGAYSKGALIQRRALNQGFTVHDLQNYMQFPGILYLNCQITTKIKEKNNKFAYIYQLIFEKYTYNPKEPTIKHKKIHLILFFKVKRTS